MECRICLEEGNTTSVCDCKGTQGQVHIKCVQQWIETSGKRECEICHAEYHPKVYTTSNVGIHTLGIVNAVLHALIVTLMGGSIKTLFTSFLFNIIQILLWVPLYDNKRESRIYVVVWTVVYFVMSTLLQMSYGVDYIHLIYDYLLTALLSIYCCILSCRKND